MCRESRALHRSTLPQKPPELQLHKISNSQFLGSCNNILNDPQKKKKKQGKCNYIKKIFVPKPRTAAAYLKYSHNHLQVTANIFRVMVHPKKKELTATAKSSKTRFRERQRRRSDQRGGGGEQKMEASSLGKGAFVKGCFWDLELSLWVP